MKRIITVILAVMCALALCACSDNGDGTKAQTKTEYKPDYGELYYASGDVKFGILDAADEVLSALGEPVSTFESNSCAYQGKDKFYYYDGFEILVGRNNRQNDQLSLKTARRDDLWLHIQKFHGTHVIICCAGAPVPDGTITEAAMLAAWYSQAREGQNVPVDVTQVRNLRKPNGAKPGMVVYDRHRTVIVTPDAALCERLRAE